MATSSPLELSSPEGSGAELASKTILLTGASGGLGACVARTLWRKGGSLILVGRNNHRLHALSAALKSQLDVDQKAHVLCADLSQPGTADQIVEQAQGVCSGLYALINNAAELGPIGPFCSNDWLLWERTIQVNLLAPAALCRAVVPWMKKSGGGKIVNISGGGATSPRPNFTAYATAKAGLVRFSETLAQELLPHNIQVNCVAPGPMNTAMLQAILSAQLELAGDEYMRVLQTQASGNAQPHNAAELIAFLVSPRTQAISGKLISAVWDPWRNLMDHVQDLRQSDVYTIRRIMPNDRGFEFK
jgi:3-oxoacyl-[acyl-carrier protein] reductase